jgi:predicted nucleic acid-binding protein
VTYLLDTTVLIDALRARNNRRSILAGIVESGHTLATSAINVGEVYAGMRSGEEAKTEAFLSNLECFPVTATIAQRGGSMKSEWARKGHTFSLADMLVAATALENNIALMTDNRKDFRMISGLTMYPLP